MTDILDTIKHREKHPELYPSKPRVIAQSRELIDAIYTMTMREKQILNHGLSTVFFSDHPPFGDHLKFEIKVTDFKKLFNIEHADIYPELKEAAERLVDRSFRIKHGDYIGEKISWLSSIKYWDNEGTIHATFTREAEEHLSNLKERFTVYELLQVANLRSFHAQRLYELLKQNDNFTNKRLFTVDEFREFMNCVTQYPKFSALKQWVIDPTLIELNEHTDIKPTLEIVYQKRTATHVKFTWKQNKQRSLI